MIEVSVVGLFDLLAPYRYDVTSPAREYVPACMHVCMYVCVDL